MIQMRMIVAALCLVLALTAACSRDGDGGEKREAASSDAATAGAAAGASPATSTQAPAAGGAQGQAPDLSRALLTLADLPTGWSEAQPPESEDDVNSGFCGTGSASVTNVGKVSAEFTGEAPGSLVAQTVSAYGVGDAKRVLDFLGETLRGCTEWRETTADGQVITYRFAPLPFPRLGDQSLTTRMKLEIGDVSVEVDIVVIRRGDIATLLAHIATASGGPPNIDSTLTERVARRADARLASVAGSR